MTVVGPSAASSSPMSSLDVATQKGYTCPIGHELLTEPVTTSDGFTYSQANIARWIDQCERSGQKPRSPCTNLGLEPIEPAEWHWWPWPQCNVPSYFVPNSKLRREVNAYRQQHPDIDLQEDAAPPPPCNELLPLRDVLRLLQSSNEAFLRQKLVEVPHLLRAPIAVGGGIAAALLIGRSCLQKWLFHDAGGACLTGVSLGIAVLFGGIAAAQWIDAVGRLTAGKRRNMALRIEALQQMQRSFAEVADPNAADVQILAAVRNELGFMQELGWDVVSPVRWALTTFFIAVPLALVAGAFILSCSETPGNGPRIASLALDSHSYMADPPLRSPLYPAYAPTANWADSWGRWWMDDAARSRSATLAPSDAASGRSMPSVAMRAEWRHALRDAAS